METTLQYISIVFTLLVTSWLTFQQERKFAIIITTTTFTCTVCYTILKYTRLLHPPKTSLSSADDAEWRCRIIATVHAIILSIGSIFCFLEWSTFDDPQYGWTWPRTTTSASQMEEMKYPYPSYFNAIFIGFLQFDLCWVIWHAHQRLDLPSIIHHSMFISIAHYVEYGIYLVRPFAWLSFTELSTPFLHFRWFLLTMNKKDGSMYIISSSLFAITFIITRVIGFGVGLIDAWLSYSLWRHLPNGFYLTIGGLHLAYALNLFWADKVLKSLIKALKNASTAKSNGVKQN